MLFVTKKCVDVRPEGNEKSAAQECHGRGHLKAMSNAAHRAWGDICTPIGSGTRTTGISVMCKKMWFAGRRTMQLAVLSGLLMFQVTRRVTRNINASMRMSMYT